MEFDLQLKEIEESNFPFLFQVYASTRAAEMKLTGWSKEDIDNFLNMQFSLQHKHYVKFYPDAKLNVIMVDGEPAGRLYAEVQSKELRIMDIALLPEFQGKGIGYYYMKQLMDIGRQKGLPVCLHVERNNPALQFYHRLGFTLKEDRDVYLYLEWLPYSQEV